jgi:hypothetical protein
MFTVGTVLWTGGVASKDCQVSYFPEKVALKGRSEQGTPMAATPKKLKLKSWKKPKELIFSNR